MRIALTTTKKTQLTVSDYYTKMCYFIDELTASGAPLCDDELIAYLLADLDEDFNPVFTAMVARVDPMTSSELYTQLLSFEHHANLQTHTSSGGSSSAIAASCGHGFPSSRGPSGPSRGTGRSHGRGCGPSRGGYSNGKSTDSNTGSSSCPQCQLCLKIGHSAKTCWYRYDEDATVDQLVASSNGDNQWYTDSGTTDHITCDLDPLTMHETYHGNDQIHATNGSGMYINRIGTSIIPTASRPLVHNKVLHVPSTHKNLISAHRFTLDNITFI
jgi:hypothetical protein